MAITATFFETPNSGTKLGYGSLKVEGIFINYIVYSSTRNESGIFVALPSRRKIVDGQQVMKDGRPEYVNDVYAEPEARFHMDEAVKNAMQNRGFNYETAAASSSVPSHNFSTPTATAAPTPAPKVETTFEQNGVADDEDLPF